MTELRNLGINLPTALLKKIDKDRGDVSRSRFITRLLEKVYGVPKRRSDE